MLRNMIDRVWAPLDFYTEDFGKVRS
jgi:hypothetical protein